MYVDWSKFLPALVLLLVPIAVFHGKRVRYRAIMREWDGYWGRTFALGLHAIDFVRAGLGAWLLAEALQTVPQAHGLMKYAVVLTQAGVLAISTTLQAFYCKESEAALAPFTFVAGLVVGFLPALMASYTSLLIGLLALVLTIVLSAGSRTGAAYFPMLAIAVAGLSFLFTGKRYMLPLVGLCGAIALPWLFTLLFPRHFVVAYLTKSSPVEPPHK